MLLTLWSLKGGSGTSTVAAGLSAAMAAAGSGSAGSDVLLVDLAGDQPALLGLARPDGPGVTDWLATDRSDADALRRLEVEVSAGLSLVPLGDAPSWPSARAGDLAQALATDGRTIVVDAGTASLAANEACGSVRSELVDALSAEGASFLVIRPCYLALRRSLVALGDAVLARPDGVVLVTEHGRALDADDVARALGLPVCATVPVDPAVARAVDAGLLSTRSPRSFGRALDELAGWGDR